MKKKSHAAPAKVVRPSAAAAATTKVRPTPKKESKEEHDYAERAPGPSAHRTQPPKDLSPELVAIRARLVTMLSDMQKDIEHEVRGASDRDVAHIVDPSDMASDAAEGDLSLRIAESETAEAGEIERAIEKVDTGTYGICEVCNKPIGADRLLFLPYVTMCIKCQELAEIRKRDDGDELADLAEGADFSDN